MTRQYAYTKTTNVLHARSLASKLAGTGVTAYSIHPYVCCVSCCVCCIVLLYATNLCLQRPRCNRSRAVKHVRLTMLWFVCSQFERRMAGCFYGCCCFRPCMKNLDQGAATQVYAALTPGLERLSGSVSFCSLSFSVQYVLLSDPALFVVQALFPELH